MLLLILLRLAMSENQRRLTRARFFEVPYCELPKIILNSHLHGNDEAKDSPDSLYQSLGLIRPVTDWLF